MKNVLLILPLLALEASAFWRLPCRGRLALERIDPIVNPGTPAMHAHAIHGGNAFSATTVDEDLLASTCSSCQVKQDNSAYWTPNLYWQGDDGTFTALNQTGGMLVYYLQRVGSGSLSDLEPFPPGFRMIAGVDTNRNYTWPDVETSYWTEADRTDQFELAQKAAGFNCLDYQEPANAALGLHAIPQGKRCRDGLRAEMFFPSCWNGRDLGTDDPRAHVAYPSLVQDGDCPAGFDHRLPSLFFETIWDIDVFWGQPGQLVFSNGDPTGYGYHGDFINGWDQDTLTNAIQTCTAESGMIEACTLFDLRTEDEMTACTLAPQMTEAVMGPLETLPGCNPVQSGPAMATTCTNAEDAGVTFGAGTMSHTATATWGASATAGISLGLSLSLGLGLGGEGTTATATATAMPTASASASADPYAGLNEAAQAAQIDPYLVVVTVTSYTTNPSAVTVETTTVDEVVQTVTAAPVYETVTAAAAKRHLDSHRRHARRAA